MEECWQDRLVGFEGSAQKQCRFIVVSGKKVK